MIEDQIIASAGADLLNRGKLPVDEDAAATAIAARALAYAAGEAWFPILSERETMALFQRDDAGMSGLGSALKKAVKKVTKVVKDVAPLAVGVGAGILTANPTVGIAAAGVTQAVTAPTPKPLVEPAATFTGGLPVGLPGGLPTPASGTPTAPGAAGTPTEPMFYGVPTRYVPYIAAGFVALLLLR